MYIPFAQTHFDSAVTLYRQRQTLLGGSECDAAALSRLEQRLRLHLHVLARCDREWPEGKNSAQVFVGLAALLSSPVPENVRAGRDRALSLLGDDGGARGQGAFAALSLFPPAAEPEQALDLYREQKSLRPLLFRLWRAQGVPLPAGLLNLAELRGGDDVALRRAVLEYAAERPEVGLGMFQAIYQPPRTQQPSAALSSDVMTAALRGGLLRGDPQARQALGQAIATCSDPADRWNLLRLAALGGSAELYPVLRAFFQENPVEGAILLGLHGSASAVEDLLAALRQARCMAAAAAGWELLTGMRLPRLACLQVVGQERSAVSAEKTIPDIEFAKDWLKGHGPWPESVRVLGGEPFSEALLLRLLRQKGGTARADLLDLLAVSIGKPMGFSPATWMERQEHELAEISTNLSTSVVSQRPS